jgi:ADP-ribose pyrophosphatase YjhB (NUDIX family)
LFINEQQEILLSDEYQLNMRMTKFPGGGMHFGEGTLDCLKREAIEEFGQEIDVLEHFYTTDYFQPTQFYDDAQLVSVYYLARFRDTIQFEISKKAFNFKEDKNGAQSFRWEKIANLRVEDFTFPIDKKVAQMLKQQ